MVSVFQKEKRVNMRKMQVSFQNENKKQDEMRIKMVLPWKAK